MSEDKKKLVVKIGFGLVIAGTIAVIFGGGNVEDVVALVTSFVH